MEDTRAQQIDKNAGIHKELKSSAQKQTDSSPKLNLMAKYRTDQLSVFLLKTNSIADAFRLSEL